MLKFSGHNRVSDSSSCILWSSDTYAASILNMFRKMDVDNVGRFQNLRIGGQASFKKNTFIFGKNTFGKSTLTAIFRSLMENNPDFIVGRRRIGGGNQMVKIFPETGTTPGEYRYTTSEGIWNANPNGLTIFDTNFVKESVYTQSQQIGQAQQNTIEAFMLGSIGIDFISRVNALTTEITTNSTFRAAITNEFSSQSRSYGGVSFAQFLVLGEDENVEDKIRAQEDKLNGIRNAGLISEKLRKLLGVLNALSTFEVDRLSMTLSIDTRLISSHFHDHIHEDSSEGRYQEFLQLGSNLRSRDMSEHCPFCTQEIQTEEAIHFLETIDAIYNERYRDLQEAFSDAKVIFLRGRLEGTLDEITSDLAGLGFSETFNFTNLYDLLDKVNFDIERKHSDLSLTFESANYLALFTEVEFLKVQIMAGLDTISDPESIAMEIAREIGTLNATKDRFGVWREKCQEYLEAKGNNERLSSEKAQIWGEYLAYAESLSINSLGEINRILRACDCNFLVKSFEFRGNQRRDLLVLSVDGADIRNEGTDLELTIKNTLSDSDKWILALAFFLASIKNDPTIQVVILDDPVSSFDADRKSVIMKEIKSIFDASEKQLVLLTHESGFFHLIHAEYSSDSASVFLKFVFDATRGSNIEVCNPDEDREFLSDFRLSVNSMSVALNSYDITEVKYGHSNIRLVMEHILKAKFPLHLAREHITLGKMLDKLEEPGGPYSVNSPRPYISDLSSNLLHHDNTGVAAFPVATLGIADYKLDITKAFEVMKAL